MKNKHLLRIGTLITILMFLLVSLPSTSVTADFTHDGGGWGVIVNTQNFMAPTLPWVFVTVPTTPPPIPESHSGETYDGTFIIPYCFLDTFTNGSGSYHRVNLTIDTVPPGGDPLFTTTGWIELDPGEGPVCSDLILFWEGYAINTVFNLTIVASCQCIQRSYTHSHTATYFVKVT